MSIYDFCLLASNTSSDLRKIAIQRRRSSEEQQVINGSVGVEINDTNKCFLPSEMETIKGTCVLEYFDLSSLAEKMGDNQVFFTLIHTSW